jgi:hypothetical protein
MEQFKSEAQLQAACVAWFWNSFPNTRGKLFAVQNNSENAIRGANRKAMGLNAGVSDLVFIHRGLTYFIELKTEIGRQSEAQKGFEQLLKVEGFDYFIVRNLESFQTIIKSIIK